MDKSVGGVVFRRSGNEPEFLLVHSARHGFWDLPKGHPEANETEEETARREILEETGCTVRIIPDFRKTINYILPQGEPKEVVFFLAEFISAADGQLIDQSEIIQSVWLDYAEAKVRISYDNSRDVLEKAYHFLNLQSTIDNG